MRRMKIRSYAYTKGPDEIKLKDGSRWRHPYRAKNSYQLDMYEKVSQEAVEKAGIEMSDIDLIIVASAGMVQMIPCTAALLQERIAPNSGIPCMDVNTTCTSFITALDVASSFLVTELYQRILIVSGDLVSHFINPNQEESYRLFSDSGVAFIVETTKENKGILYSKQETWSEGAHTTEIRGGLTAYGPSLYSEDTKEDFLFDMDGKSVLMLTLDKLPKMLKETLQHNNIQLSDISKIVPHQASRALFIVERKLKLKKGQLINYFEELGNMVSGSVPYTLGLAMDQGEIKEGDLILLIGTAAGLTMNCMLIQL